MLKFSPLQLIGLLAVMLSCFTVSITVAYNIGAIVSGYGASPAQAGLVATAQGLATAVAAVLASRFAGNVGSRWFFLAGLGVLVIGNGFSALAPNVQQLTAYQALGGFGTGLVLSTVMSTAARTANPEMTYGIINASMGGYIVALGFLVPRVILAGGVEQLFLVYAAIAAAGFIAAFAAPNSKAPEDAAACAQHAGEGGDQADKTRRQAKLVAFIALTGFGVFFFAQAGLGAFVERIGVGSGVPLTAVGYVFALGGVLTIIGPLIAGWIGARFGATLPLIVVTAALGCVVFALAVIASPTTFYTATPLYTVLPAMLMPSFLGALAVVDPSGKAAGLQPAFATLGGALGPAASGVIVQQNGYGALGWYAIAVFVTGAALMAAATIAADRKRKGATATASANALHEGIAAPAAPTIAVPPSAGR
ncbi:MFS transporter [Erythrobacter ani]|uniref:MFS transporter n=1 Tax=Erythrobacter ani TaxID=2827235 RepID=A0ABS6SRS9_9SPHN|nr:MFS transporter [Erythrobacter ani]MBV7267531.1 MFS transporter [Erythrobacter ani]